MKPPANLEHRDRIHANAASGWVGLGDVAAAQEELAQLSPECLDHPVVLHVRAEICQAGKQWDEVIALTETLIQQLPDDCDAWIHRSYALHELKRTQDAFDLLRPAATRFPQVSVIPYNLACYICQLGKLEEAMQYLKLAIKLARKDHDILKDALADVDLKPLWGRIREW